MKTIIMERKEYAIYEQEEEEVLKAVNIIAHIALEAGLTTDEVFAVLTEMSSKYMRSLFFNDIVWNKKIKQLIGKYYENEM